jgi:PAS domain S-box-containing protein
MSIISEPSPLTEAAPRVSLVSTIEKRGHCDHLVTFYESDTALVASLADYVHTGLTEDESCIVIASPEHRASLEQAMALLGVDLEFERVRGRYVPLDAAGTLAEFMVGDMPDSNRFRDTIGPVVEEAARRGRHVRAFGEMVALLCSEGHPQGAIALEALWNDLAAVQPFSLYCAYPIDSFSRESDGITFEQICGHHSRVIPSETYSAVASADDRMREIARLQQRARALEAEVAYRRQVEAALAQRERELSDFFENAVEGLHKVDRDGIILWANRAELDMLGYSADEYIGKPIFEFHIDRELVESMLDRLVNGEAIINQSAQLRCRDGAVKHVLVNSNGHFDNGEFTHSRCFSRDVTELVKMREDIDRHLEEIKTLNSRLQRAVTETHHRVKNNLQVISALIEMLALEHKGENAVPLNEFSRIQSHVRTLAVVHDLLTASARDQEARQFVSTKHVLDRLLPMLQQTAWDKKVHFQIEQIELPSKQCVALALVINELVTNALKHGNTEAEILLTVTDRLAELQVLDDGPGFPRDFDPEKSANTGLELVASLVRTDLRGHAEFLNRKSGGACVVARFEIPDLEDTHPQDHA